METTNTFPNDSNLISSSEILNANLEESAHSNASWTHDRPGDVVLVICTLGLPGNLLVIAVYVWAMTSSMRVYMFSLAVSDTAVCLCGIILVTAPLSYVSTLAFTFIINLSLGFSSSLLVFVSIERLLAVRRPHSFTMRAQRAKTIVASIAAVGVVYVTSISVAHLMQYNRLVGMAELTWMSAVNFIMVMSYALIAVSLLKKGKRVSNCTGTSHVVEPTYTSGQRKESANTTAVGYIHSTVLAISHATIHPIVADRAAMKKTNTYKNVLLLFIITFVFIVTWLPHYLFSVGVPVHSEVRRLFVLNSALNPVIYCVASAMFRDDVRQFYRHRLLSWCHQ